MYLILSILLTIHSVDNNVVYSVTDEGKAIAVYTSTEYEYRFRKVIIDCKEYGIILQGDKIVYGFLIDKKVIEEK